MAGIAESPAHVAAGEQFLATLAHEICNAVGPIRNGMDLLQTEGIDEATSRWAQGLMRRQIGQLVWMVEGLRDASRLRRGLIQLHKSLRRWKTWSAGVEMAQPLIAGYEHTLIVDLADERRSFRPIGSGWPRPWPICCRTRAIQRSAGANLDFHRSRRPALVRVRDEGIGIEAEMLPRIFDLFMPAEPSAERRQGGLGTGLTLVRGLVELHGGTVEACSQGADRGSEFCIRLPRLREVLG